MLDATDIAILQLLQKNSRLQWRELGQSVHLSGPAVAERVRKMQDAGVIEAFTLQINEEKRGLPLTAFITVFLNNYALHPAFQAFAASEPAFTEIHRVSGEGCYWLRASLPDAESLNRLLDNILRFANYKVQISLGKLK